ncbi:MAG: hypothetical protein ACLTOW_09910 [Blautia wexlerae]
MPILNLKVLEDLIEQPDSWNKKIEFMELSSFPERYENIATLGKTNGYIHDKVFENMEKKSNNIAVLETDTHKSITYAALAAYGYDIKKRMEKLRMKVVIMYGGNELFAAKSVSLVKEKCVSECEVYAYDNMGHSEVLSLHPEKLCEIIRK